MKKSTFDLIGNTSTNKKITQLLKMIHTLNLDMLVNSWEL